MKRFLSVLLAVMMVLSSTVSYAAPSLADFVDSVIEAPEFEDELFEETPVEDDSATLSEETVTFNDVIEFDFETDTTPFTASADGIVGASTGQFRGAALTQVIEDGVGALKININEGGNNTKFMTNKYGDVNSGMNFVINARRGQLKKFEIRFKSSHMVSSLYGNNGTKDIVKADGSSTVPLGQNPSVVADGEAGWYIGTRTNFDGWSHSNVAKCQFGFNGTFAIDDVAYVDYVRFELYNPVVTIKNDVQFIDDYKQKIVGGTYTLDEIKAMLDPNGVMFDKGYYLAMLVDEDGTEYTDEVTFTEDAAYTAVWDKIKVLKSWEFTNGAESGAAPTYVSTVEYDDGLLYMYKPTGSQPRITLSFDRIEVSDISDIVTKVKFVGTGFNKTTKSMGSVFVSGWNSNGYQHGEVEKTTDANGTYGGQMSGATFVATDNEWTIGKFSEDFTDGKVAADTVALKGIRFNFSGILTNGAEQGVYVDYIRILGTDTYSTDNALIDMSLAPVDVPNFKVFLDEATTVADVLAAADAALAEAEYNGPEQAKAVYLNGTKLDAATPLASQGVGDQSKLKIIFGSKILYALEFDTNDNSWNSQTSFNSGTNTGVYDTEAGTVTFTSDGTKSSVYFNINGLNINTSDLEDIEIRAKFKDYPNSGVAAGGVLVLNAGTFKNSSDKTVSVGFTPINDEWITISCKNALNSIVTPNPPATITSARPFHWPTSAYSVEIDYIRFIGKNFGTKYTLDIDGEIVEVDGAGMTTVANLLAADAVTATDKIPGALRIVGTDTVLSPNEALSDLYEAETLEVIWTDKQPITAYEFANGAETGVSVNNSTPSYSDGTLRVSYGTSANPYLAISTGASGIAPADLYDIVVKLKYDGTSYNNSSLLLDETHLAGDGKGYGAAGKAANGNYTVTDGVWSVMSYAKTISTFHTNIGTLTNLTGIRFGLNSELTKAGESVYIDYIRFLGKNNMPYVAVLDGFVGGEPVTVTVPYDANTTVADAIAIMALDNEAGYVTAIGGATGTTTLASLLGNDDGVLKFDYLNRTPATLIIDGEEHTAYFESTDTAAVLLANEAVEGTGKVACALRVVGEKTVLTPASSLAGIAANTELQVIFTKGDDFGFNFDKVLKDEIEGKTTNIFDEKYWTATKDGDNYYAVMPGTSGSRVYLNNLSIPAGKLSKIHFTFKYTGSAIGAPGMFWDSVESTQVATSAGFSYSLVDLTKNVYKGQVTADTWFSTYINASSLKNTDKTNYAGSEFMNVTGLKFMRIDLSNGVYVDDIRFEGVDVLPVAIVDGVYNGEEVTYTVPYGETTTVADVAEAIGIDSVEGRITSIGGKSEGTIQSILGGETGIVEFVYTELIPVTLVIDGEKVAASYLEGDTVATLLANSAVTSTFKTPVALRVVGEDTVLFPTDSLDGVAEGTEFLVVFTELNSLFSNEFTDNTKGFSSDRATVSHDKTNGYMVVKSTTDKKNIYFDISLPSIDTTTISDIVVRLRYSDTDYNNSTIAESIYYSVNDAALADAYTFEINYKATNNEWTHLSFKEATGKSINQLVGNGALTKIRLSFNGELAVDDIVTIDYIRILGKDASPVAIIDGVYNGKEVTYTVPYGETTTVADVAKTIGLDSASGYISSIGGKTEGTIQSILNGKTGITEFVYTERIPVNLIVDGETVDAYVENTDTVAKLFAHDAVVATAKIPRAVIPSGKKTLLHAEDSLADVVEGDTFEVIFTQADDFGFDFHAGTGGTVGSHNTSYTTVTGPFTEGDVTYKRFSNITSTNNQFRMIFSGLNIPANKLSDIYVTLRSTLAKPYGDFNYMGLVGATGFDTSFGSSVLGTPSVIGTQAVNTWYTLHYDIDTTNSLYKNGVGYIRYDFNTGLTAPGDYVDIADIRFVGTDILPVAVFDLSNIGGKSTVAVPYGKSTTVAQVIEALTAEGGFDTNEYTISSIGGLTTGTIYDGIAALGGKDAFVDVVAVSNIDLRIDNNIHPAADFTADDIIAPAIASYAPTATVADVLADIYFNEDYHGVWTVAGLAYGPEDYVLPTTVAVSELAYTDLYIVWKELNVIAGFEFNTKYDFNRLTTLGFRNLERTGHPTAGTNPFTDNTADGYATVNLKSHEKAVNAAAEQAAAGGTRVHAIEGDTGINAFRIDAGAGEADKIVVRLRYTLPEKYESIAGNAEAFSVNADAVLNSTAVYEGANLKAPSYHYWKNSTTHVSGSNTGSYSAKKLNEMGWFDVVIDKADFDSTGLYSFRFDTNGYPDGTTIDIDYIRVYGTAPVKYFTVNLNGLDANTESKMYSFNDNTTVAQLAARIGDDFNIGKYTAIGGIIVNDTTYSGETKVSSVVNEGDTVTLSHYTATEYTVDLSAIGGESYEDGYTEDTTVANVLSDIRTTCADYFTANPKVTVVGLKVSGSEEILDTATTLKTALGGSTGTVVLVVSMPVALTVDVSDIGEAEAFTSSYGLNTTVADILAEISTKYADYFTANPDKSVVGLKDSNESILNGTVKLADYFENASDSLTLVVRGNITVTINEASLTVTDDANSAITFNGGNLSKAYSATAKISEILADFTKLGDSYYGLYYFEGVSSEAEGIVYSADSTLFDVFGDVTEKTLYVVWDKMNLLFSFEGDEMPKSNNVTGFTDALADGKLTLTSTGSTGATYFNISGLSIDIPDIEDIVFRVKVPSDLKAPEYFMVYTSDTVNDKTVTHSYTAADNQFHVVSFNDKVDHELVGNKLKAIRPLQYRNIGIGQEVVFDYIRVIGKPLPEVNVDGTKFVIGTNTTSVTSEFNNIDYTKDMTFADLIEKLEFVSVYPYHLIRFESADGETTYNLSENMFEVLGNTGTTEIVPVIEKVYTKTHTVHFGEQAEYFEDRGVIAPSITVSDYTKTVADLEALMVDQGDKFFLGFAAEEGSTELIDSNTVLAASSQSEFESGASSTVTYYAVWEDYITNDFFSIEFTEAEGYALGNPGKASKYENKALDSDGKTCLYADAEGNIPVNHSTDFFEHITEADGKNGYVRLKFDASPYAIAQVDKPIQVDENTTVTPTVAGTWDSHIVFSDFIGAPYIPAGVFDKVIIRMRYGGDLPTKSVTMATPGSGKGYQTISPADFFAPFFYYTNEDYANFTDSQKYSRTIDVSKDIYNNKWITVVIDAADLELDTKDIYDFRLDPSNGMPDGTWLDIDYIRFTQKREGVVNEESIKSVKDFEAEGDARADVLATNIRAAVKNDGLNGVRVMGWLYVYADASAHTKNAGWMFSASNRFQKAVADSEDGWMNKLTMDLYNDANFNTSSLILVGNYIENGKKVTTPQDYDSENPLFSAVLYNIPVKNYKSNFVVRPYVEYAGNYLYGEPFEMNFYDFAFGTDYTGDIAGAGGAYGACDNHDCAICNYLEECYADWLEHAAAKATFEAHYNTYFKNILASPDNLIGNIVVPTGTISNNTDATVDLEVLNNATGKLETVTVNKANTWPALVVDGKLNSLYTLRPCVLNSGYILSLGYGRDSDNGNHAGIEKTDTSVLNGEAAADANEMFIRNRFVPEAQSPFRQINRLAQLPMTGANASNDTFVNSFFLGDHGFGDYWFSTTIWSGTTREYWAGKTAYPLDNAKVVVKYNYADGTSEWVTYDKTALYNLTTIDFSNISYIVSNDIDNKPVDNETVSGSANGISYSGVECPFEVEDLVFLFGEVDVPAASADSIEFNTDVPTSSFTKPSTANSMRVYDGSADGNNYYLYGLTSASYVANGIANLTQYSNTYKSYISTTTSGISLDAALYNTIRIRMKYDSGNTGFTLSYTTSDGGTGSVTFNVTTYGGVDAEGYRIIDVDLSEVYSWRNTVTSVKITANATGTSTYHFDYIRFLATGYDSNAELELIDGIFEGFEKGFTINGFEGSSNDAFKPTVEFFETTEEAKNGYASFDPKADVDGDGDTNYADWTIDPLYTYDYYGVYNNIIKKSANYSATVEGDDATWNFSSLYNGNYRDLRWNTMVADSANFTKYYSNYELKNTTIDGYNAIADEEHTYTIDDKQYTKRSKEIIYKPDYEYTVNGQQKRGNVLTMTLNSSALYKGAAQKQWSKVLPTEQQAWHFWPHLLIQQSRGSQPVKVWEENGKLVTDEKYSAAADRIFAEFDIRLKDFEKIGSESINMSFLLYAYLCPNVNPAAKIWFGIPLADDSGASSGGMSWGRESGANTHMCSLSQAMVYGSTEGSVAAIIQDILNGTDKATYNLGDWIHVKLDLTPYIDMAIEMSNAEDAFGLGVTSREDWHFNGVNVGYECSGNVDATFEFANFNFYSYNEK